MPKVRRVLIAFAPFLISLWLFVAPPYDPYVSRALQALVLASLIGSVAFAVTFLLTAGSQRPARAFAISLFASVALGVAGVATVVLLVRG